VTRIGELGTALAATRMLFAATRHNIPEDAILHSHRRLNLKSYLYSECFKLKYRQISVSGLVVVGIF
jgi:hypothetical protein